MPGGGARQRAPACDHGQPTSPPKLARPPLPRPLQPRVAPQCRKNCSHNRRSQRAAQAIPCRASARPRPPGEAAAQRAPRSAAARRTSTVRPSPAPPRRRGGRRGEKVAICSPHSPCIRHRPHWTSPWHSVRRSAPPFCAGAAIPGHSGATARRAWGRGPAGPAPQPRPPARGPLRLERARHRSATKQDQPPGSSAWCFALVPGAGRFAHSPRRRPPAVRGPRGPHGPVERMGNPHAMAGPPGRGDRRPQRPQRPRASDWVFGMQGTAKLKLASSRSPPRWARPCRLVVACQPMSPGGCIGRAGHPLARRLAPSGAGGRGRPGRRAMCQQPMFASRMGLTDFSEAARLMLLSSMPRAVSKSATYMLPWTSTTMPSRLLKRASIPRPSRLP